MNRKPVTVPLLAATVAGALAASAPALAHHSFAMFDQTKEVELKDATVVDWQWTSPHAWLYVMVPNGTGEPDKYSVEAANPGQLRRDGFSKGSMSPGDKVTVYMAPLKSGEKGGAQHLAVRQCDGRRTAGRQDAGRTFGTGTGPAAIGLTRPSCIPRWSRFKAISAYSRWVKAAAGCVR